MSGELNPTLGDIRPHGHLKLGRFTQHFVDVLDLSQTPLEFFEKMYPTDTYDEQRKYLGRFGVSGKMQMRKMEELSDGQKSRVVLAKLGRDVPHIVSTTCIERYCVYKVLSGMKDMMIILTIVSFGSYCWTNRPITWIWKVLMPWPRRSTNIKVVWSWYLTICV